MKKILFLFFIWVGVQCLALTPAHAETPRRNTDIQVDSTDMEPFSSFNKRSDPDEKPVFYSDSNTTIGFNDDGEPNVGTRF